MQTIIFQLYPELQNFTNHEDIVRIDDKIECCEMNENSDDETVEILQN